MSKLKVYADRMSQPSRAVIIFCKVNGIDFEEVGIRLGKRQHLTPQFKGIFKIGLVPAGNVGKCPYYGLVGLAGIEINPMGQVPAIVYGEFKLFESHAILRYLACSFPGIADHWYPTDVFTRAKINSVLDWHHSNLRRGVVSLIRNSVFAPVLGVPPNPEAAAEGEKLLCSSLSRIESLWLKGNSKFLCGLSQPSIADLSLVCEIMQLEFLNEEHRERILGSHEKVLQWMKNLKDETNPHFEEVHGVLAKVRAVLQQKGSSTKLVSKL